LAANEHACSNSAIDAGVEARLDILLRAMHGAKEALIEEEIDPLRLSCTLGCGHRVKFL